MDPGAGFPEHHRTHLMSPPAQELHGVLVLKWLAAPSEGSQKKVSSRRHAADSIFICPALELDSSLYSLYSLLTCVDEASIEVFPPQLQPLLQVPETVLYEVGIVLQVRRDVHKSLRDNLWRSNNDQTFANVLPWGNRCIKLNRMFVQVRVRPDRPPRSAQ
jgi:hypothetical protein